MRETRARAVAVLTGLLVVGAVVLFAVLQQRPAGPEGPAADAARADTAEREADAEPDAEAERTGPGEPDTVAVPSEEELALGRRVYAENRCARCHSIEGEGGRRSALDGVGSRLTREEIRLWIVDPQRIGPGVRKPSYDLPARELEALIGYMQSLRED